MSLFGELKRRIVCDQKNPIGPGTDNDISKSFAGALANR